MRWVVGLYPPAWRDRYGAEFVALLEDVGPGWRVFWNVVRGAIEMQMNLWTFPRMTAACGLLGAILALAVAYQIEDRYVSCTVLRVNLAGGDPRDVATEKWVEQMRPAVLTRNVLWGIITNPARDLYKRERQREPLEDIVRSMATRDIQITPLRGGNGRTNNAILLGFTYSDPRMAQAVARDLAARILDVNLAHGGFGSNLEVLDPANIPQRPVSPNRLAFAVLGLVGGAVLGFVIMGIRRRAMRPASIQ
jgi:hypothetical protein